MPATITSVAHYFPPDVYPNSYFESYLDTSNEWIIERTGIRERRFSRNGATSDLIVPASRQCLEQRGISPESIDCIIVSTVTPDYMFPATAAVVQNKLGLKNAWGFDLSAACSGYLFGLVTAAKLVESGAVRNVLLCGADKMSAIVDFQDRTQAVLFGDGAAVTLIEMSDDPELGVLDHILRIDGEGGKYLYQAAGGSFKPATIETVQNREHYIHQEGQAVFKSAVIGMAEVTLEIMKKNNLRDDDVDWLVPHQANLRIITATAQRMGLPMEKVMVNIDKYANTTAATIPSCLSEWYQAGKLKRGNRLILASFGAGFTWGAVYMRWSMD
ncbi:MAG: beta-ketoacyl-ACP synthase III [Candidatus Kapaibacteriales bacterium]